MGARPSCARSSRLRAQPLKDVVDWLGSYQRFWEEGFDLLDEACAPRRVSAAMAEASGASGYGVRITRVFDAPRDRVWKEWTEPERFADWFGGRECEAPLSSVSMDVRPGGTWRLAMFALPPPADRLGGDYREVEAPDRLVFTIAGDLPDDDPFELVTVVLTDLGDDRTEMLFEQRGSMPPEEYERATEGWSTFFDHLQERLSAAEPARCGNAVPRASGQRGRTTPRPDSRRGSEPRPWRDLISSRRGTAPPDTDACDDYRLGRRAAAVHGAGCRATVASSIPEAAADPLGGRDRPGQKDSDREATRHHASV